MKKKLISALLCTAMVGTMLAGCGGGQQASADAETKAATEAKTEAKTEAGADSESAAETDAAGGEEKHYKFGFTCMDGTNPFFVKIEETMREIIEANGDELIAVDPGNDITKQIPMIEDLIVQDIDGLFVNPADAEGIMPAMDQIKDAAIPAVGFDAEIADLSYLISYAGSDNYNAGFVCGEDLVKKYPDGGDILILEHITAQSVRDRVEGFEAAIEGKGFHVVGRQDAEGNLEKSQDITEDLLTANPNVIAIFGGNDPTALGALAAARSHNLKDIMIYGVDGSPDIKAELAKEDTLIEGTGAQSPVAIAEKAVEIMYQYLEGQEVDARYPVDTFLITAENVSEYGTDGWQ